MWRVLFLILFFLPQSSLAAIIISEVAWMGDSTSANNEWIELHNTGDSVVDITDWTLSDGMNLEISLAGSIGAGQYAVLERNRSSGQYLTSSPFLIYTGALVNTGATLTLRRADSSIEDQISGGEGWQSIGGDNTTKDTAQYSTNGWITAVPTPGRVNASSASSVITNTAKNTLTSSTGNVLLPSKKTETVRLTSPNWEMKLALDIQATAYVNQKIPLRVTPSGLGETFINSLKYTWNFGDLATSSVKDPTHTYSYPGTYVVTLHATFAKYTQVVRQEITILPVTISLTKNAAGDIQVNNDAPYDVDLSGYTLVGNETVIFPSRTIITARGTITVPKARVSRPYGQSVTLYDARKTVVASSLNQPVATAVTEVIPVVSTSAVTTPNISEVPLSANITNPRFGFVSAEATTTATQTTTPIPIVTEPTPALSANILANNASNTAIPPSSNNRLWTFVALALILIIALGGLFASKPRN